MVFGGERREHLAHVPVIRLNNKLLSQQAASDTHLPTVRILIHPLFTA